MNTEQTENAPSQTPSLLLDSPNKRVKLAAEGAAEGATTTARVKSPKIIIVSKRSRDAFRATDERPVIELYSREPYKSSIYALDTTSKSKNDFGQRLSPFSPHGGIPVPGQPEGTFSESVEGVWQGLKVIDGKTDFSKFRNATGMRLKRSSNGKTITGHQFEGETLGYVEARKRIYVPTYEWMLRNRIMHTENWKALVELSTKRDIWLIDYDVNEDVEDVKKPLSHASIIKKWLTIERDAFKPVSKYVDGDRR